MPSETLHSLHCRARSFVRRVLTAAAEMQAGGEREEKCTADLAKVENRGREGAPEAEGQRGPARVLLVSHGGLLLQMFQKVIDVLVPVSCSLFNVFGTILFCFLKAFLNM